MSTSDFVKLINNTINSENQNICLKIDKIIKSINNFLPKTKILLLGLLPNEGDDSFVPGVNDVLKNFYTDPQNPLFNKCVTYFDPRDGLKNKKEAYTDGLHLTSVGYQYLTNIVEPLINGLID